MSDRQASIERISRSAADGRWEELLTLWEHDPLLAQACSRFRDPHSGWTLLHHAAHAGQAVTCRELIRLGAATTAITDAGATPADIAARGGDPTLAELLRRAADGADSLWSAPDDVDLLPSSSLWAEARERQAPAAMRVGYAGGVVTIPAGSGHFVDSFGRTLVGWHGTYDPPSGMDGESLIEH